MVGGQVPLLGVHSPLKKKKHCYHAAGGTLSLAEDHSLIHEKGKAGPPCH